MEARVTHSAEVNVLCLVPSVVQSHLPASKLKSVLCFKKGLKTLEVAVRNLYRPPARQATGITQPTSGSRPSLFVEAVGTRPHLRKHGTTNGPIRERLPVLSSNSQPLVCRGAETSGWPPLSAMLGSGTRGGSARRPHATRLPAQVTWTVIPRCGGVATGDTQQQL